MTRASMVKVGAFVAALLLVFSGCGSSDESASPPTESAGQRLVEQHACGACHGADLSGGTASALAGLYESTVELSDGTTIVADRDYLVESIEDPSAKLVKGYPLAMPETRLSDDEIQQVVDFLIQLK